MDTFYLEEGKRYEAMIIFRQLSEMEPGNNEWDELLRDFEEI